MAEYSINLTLGELLFAAAQAGLERLPLPALGGQPLSPDQLAAEQHAGRELLETRGLLRRAADGWRLEAFLAAAVHWLAAPDRAWMLRRFQRGGGESQLAAFLKARQILLAEHRHAEFRLSVRDGLRESAEQLCAWMGLDQQAATAAPLPALNRQNFLALQAALAGPLADGAAREPSSWSRVEFVSSLTWVAWAGGSPRAEAELGFAGSRAELWRLDRPADAPDTILPVPVAAAQACDMLLGFWSGPADIPPAGVPAAPAGALP